MTEEEYQEWKEKRKKKGYKKVDISEMNFDFSFIGDDYESIKKYLNKFSYSTFGWTDEEIVHLTILKGCRFAHKYDPTKANKLTWLSSILFNEVLSVKAAKRKHIAIELDDERDEEKDYKNLLAADNADESDENLTEYVNTIMDILNNGAGFPYLKDRVVNRMTYEDIANKYGKAAGTIKTGIFNERKRLRKLLENIKQADHICI